MNKQQFSSWVHRFCIPTGLMGLLLDDLFASLFSSIICEYIYNFIF